MILTPKQFLEHQYSGDSDFSEGAACQFAQEYHDYVQRYTAEQSQKMFSMTATEACERINSIESLVNLIHEGFPIFPHYKTHRHQENQSGCWYCKVERAAASLRKAFGISLPK